jgi:hypothetical protein
LGTPFPPFTGGSKALLSGRFQGDQRNGLRNSEWGIEWVIQIACFAMKENSAALRILARYNPSVGNMDFFSALNRLDRELDGVFARQIIGSDLSIQRRCEISWDRDGSLEPVITHVFQGHQVLKDPAPNESKAMKVLAEETRINLFMPAGRGILLTDEGRTFAERSRKLLEEYERLRLHPGGIPNLRQSIKIASFEVFTTYLMGPLLQDHLADYSVSLYELVPGSIEEAVASSKADFGITYIPIPHPALDHVKILDLEMGLFWKAGAFDKKPFPEIPFAVPITPARRLACRDWMAGPKIGFLVTFSFDVR